MYNLPQLRRPRITFKSAHKADSTGVVSKDPRWHEQKFVLKKMGWTRFCEQQRMKSNPSMKSTMSDQSLKTSRL